MASRRKVLWTAILIAAAYAIARLGRLVLDSELVAHPNWGAVGERIGGWLIGLVIVVVVVLPLFKLHGLFDKTHDSEK